MGNETPKIIARELVQTVKQNVSIDWTGGVEAAALLRAQISDVQP